MRERERTRRAVNERERSKRRAVNERENMSFRKGQMRKMECEQFQ